jgi:hypothetical protein
MKLAIAILVLGAATLVALLMPSAPGSPSWLAFAWETRRINGIQLALGAGVPLGIGIWALLRGPLVRWQAIAATAGFGVVFLKVQIYRGLTRVLDAPISFQVMTAAVLLGLVTSVVAIVVASDG